MLQRLFLFCLLFLAQGAHCADESAYLPHWLVGTIAVCVFLVLAFAFMLVNHYLCANLFVEEYDEEDEEHEGNSYKNHMGEIEDDMPQVKVVEGSDKSSNDDRSYQEIKVGAVQNDYSVIEQEGAQFQGANGRDSPMTTAL